MKRKFDLSHNDNDTTYVAKDDNPSASKKSRLLQGLPSTALALKMAAPSNATRCTCPPSLRQVAIIVFSSSSTLHQQQEEDHSCPTNLSPKDLSIKMQRKIRQSKQSLYWETLRRPSCLFTTQAPISRWRILDLADYSSVDDRVIVAKPIAAVPPPTVTEQTSIPQPINQPKDLLSNIKTGDVSYILLGTLPKLQKDKCELLVALPNLVVSIDTETLSITKWFRSDARVSCLAWYDGGKYLIECGKKNYITVHDWHKVNSSLCITDNNKSPFNLGLCQEVPSNEISENYGTYITAQLYGHQSHVLQVLVDEEKGLMVSSGVDATIHMWNLNTFGPLTRVQHCSSNSPFMCKLNHGKLMVVNTVMHMWKDMYDGRPWGRLENTIEFMLYSEIHKTMITAHGNLIYISKDTLQVEDVQKNTNQFEGFSIELPYEGVVVKDIIFLDEFGDGNFILVTDSDGNLTNINFCSGEIVQTFPKCFETITPLAIA